MTALAKDTSGFVETVIEDETVVMILASGDFFSLRDSARDVWELIDGRRDRDAIVHALAQSYAAPAGEIAPDVDAFLAELRATGLLAVV